MKINPFPILRVALPVPIRRLFEYLPYNLEDFSQISIGSRIKVPFQRRELIGILVDKDTDSEFPIDKLKPALSVIDKDSIFTPELWKLCLWAADYYHHPIGEVLFGALPALLRKGKVEKPTQERYWKLTNAGLSLDPEGIKRPRQKLLLELLCNAPNGLALKELKAHHISKMMVETAASKGWIYFEERIVLPSPQHSLKNALLLNEAQEEAVKTIQAEKNKFNVFLIDGVTGSGKTEVYLQVIADYLTTGKQILVLVPEIGLTPQTIQRFRERFSVPIIAIHSGLSEKERLNSWLAAKTSYAKIIIGTRSAIFTPFANLGLIIVDEEHDLSFKQQEGFRYHARDVAIMRAHFNKIPIVLGSATPSLETLHKAEQGKFKRLQLLERAGEAQSPDIHILDVCKTPLEHGLSERTLKEMTRHLENGDQVMLFLNRRGFAPVLMCHGCGWVAHCRRCDARLTYHHVPPRLYCHHCNTQRSLFKKCEACGDTELAALGLGTERIEDALQKHFPKYSIARIDRDSTQRKGVLENLLDKIQRREHQILIGTQMLAKGHHFPHVTFVGIIDADAGFFSTDFRAIERMGQLILQVSGRAGRAQKKGEVLIQTHHPDHPLLHQLLRKSYHEFAVSLLKERKQAALPPYFFFALFRAEAYDPQHAIAFLQQIKNTMDILPQNIGLLGPIPAPMSRRAGRHRAQLLIQSLHRPVLHDFLKKILIQVEKFPSKHRIKWSIDIDPLEMF